jgi:outer membrane lipoprotein-sorting protein
LRFFSRGSVFTSKNNACFGLPTGKSLFRLPLVAIIFYLLGMKKLIFCLTLSLFLPLTAMGAAPLTAANDPDVAKAESYLQSLDTAAADFVQVSSLGSRLSGQFFLDRPGRLRFNYNEVDDFIVADGVFIYFYDSQLGSQSNAPIGQTLADFLLREDLSLSGELRVTQLYKKDGEIFVTVVQRDDPAVGLVELVFTEVPYALSRWRVTDAQGHNTEVRLKNLRTGVRFTDSQLFAYHDPKGRKRVND